MKSIAIVGSRGFNDYAMFCTILGEYLGNSREVAFVSGGAAGADTFAARYANEHGIVMNEIKPNWLLYGKSAGFIRNSTIIESADEVIAFWDGQSKGTLDSIKKANKLNKPTLIVDYTKV